MPIEDIEYALDLASKSRRADGPARATAAMKDGGTGRQADRFAIAIQGADRAATYFGATTSVS